MHGLKENAQNKLLKALAGGPQWLWEQ